MGCTLFQYSMPLWGDWQVEVGRSILVWERLPSQFCDSLSWVRTESWEWDESSLACRGLFLVYFLPTPCFLWVHTSHFTRVSGFESIRNVIYGQKEWQKKTLFRGDPWWGDIGIILVLMGTKSSFTKWGRSGRWDFYLKEIYQVFIYM